MPDTSFVSAVRSLFTKPLPCTIDTNLDDAVYLSDTGTIDKATSSTDYLGLVVLKPTATTCVVQFDGEFDFSSSVLTPLTPGATYYVSDTPGQLSTVPAYNEIIVGLALDNKTLILAHEASAHREILKADRTYYVRTTGNDANDGSANDDAHAFKTVQHAVNVIALLDGNGFIGRIKIADGTYIEPEGVNLLALVGFKIVEISSVSGIANNVIVQDDPILSDGAVFLVQFPPCVWELTNLTLRALGADGVGVFDQGCICYLNGVNHVNSGFGAAITVSRGVIYVFNHFSITGSNRWTFYVLQGGLVSYSGTLTLVGIPAWTESFVGAYGISLFLGRPTSIVGSATGKRYVSEQNSVIQTFGGGANAFPGDVAGSTADGGIYIA